MKRFLTATLLLWAFALTAVEFTNVPLSGTAPTRSTTVLGTPGYSGYRYSLGDILNIPPQPYTALPFVTVSAKGIANSLSTLTNDGKMFGPDTVGTLTCGLQEAINSLPISTTNFHGTSGGTIVLGPGIYWTYAGITVPAVSNAYSLSIVGPGQSAGGITYIGATASHVLKVGQGGTFNACLFTMRNMWIASNNNSPTNIVWLEGPFNSVDNHGGGVGAAAIEWCWIGYWNSMTNNASSDGSIFTPSGVEDGGVKHNLIGLDVNLSNNNLVHVNGCNFSYCLVGISIAADHPFIENNVFTYCRSNYQYPNDWDWSTSWKIGAGLVVYHGRGNTYNCMYPHTWRCMGNSYITGNTTNTPAIVVDVEKSGGCGANQTMHLTFDYESVEGYGPLIATTRGICTFVSPSRYWNIDVSTNDLPQNSPFPIVAPLERYYITNMTDYSTWTNVWAGNNLVRVLDWYRPSVDANLTLKSTSIYPEEPITNIYSQYSVTLWNSNNLSLWVRGTNGVSKLIMEFP